MEPVAGTDTVYDHKMISEFATAEETGSVGIAVEGRSGYVSAR
jgi:hypothetical protein